MGTVRFGNDHIAAILGFGDLQWGNILITRVYFVEGLGHNLFSVGQFCDSDIEPICLMARASSTKLWLWHQRLSHLNFDTINDLARNDLVAVERRNRTLVEAARTMLIFSRAPLFLWAEAIATACFTQNRSIIHRRFKKTPYELINGRKPDISFLHVFGALCYPKNDREDIGKLGAKGDIGFFIGYSADSCAYRIYNQRTKKIMETMNVSSDELSVMDFEQRSSKPRLNSMTSGQISSGLDLTYAPSTITTQQPSEGELDLLFEVMYDDYIGGQPLATGRTVSPAQEPQSLISKAYFDILRKSRDESRHAYRWFYHEDSIIIPMRVFSIGNLKLLINFVWKFMGTVRFENDHVAAILGFGDLLWGNILITRVYFVKGLGHNLFSVGKFCDFNLETDREDIRKLGAKGDIGFFIGYFADSCAYRIYNRRTKKIMETMNVSFDELSAMAFEQRELDLLFKAMYDDYIGGQPSVTRRIVPPAQEPQVRQSSTASTTIADIAPTPTKSSSLATNILITSHDVDELNSNAMVDGNTFVNPFANSSTSAAAASSSQNDLEIIKLKIRVKKLERANKVKTVKLRRLRKIGTSQRIESSDDTHIEDMSNQGRMIDKLEKDEGAELMNEKETEEVRVNPDDAQVEGRQADIYHNDMDHATKVLSMQEDKPEIQEAVKVVTTTKLITEVVAAVSEIVSVAVVVQTDVPAAPVNAAAVVTTAAPVKVVVPSTSRIRGVVIRDTEEESSAKTPTKTKSKDKGKGIMVEEPKLIKKKQQVELDDAYARKLQDEINQEIDWEVEMDHVKQKAKENPYVQMYQVMKKRPQTEAQARRNMMVYLKNITGFTLDFLKESKRRRLNKEAKDVEELKQHLEIVPDKDDNVHIEATPLARKVPVVDYQIIHIILLVERRYPLSKFTLEQMLNVVRLQVEEQSEMSLELIKFTRQQLQEGQHN
nr:retrovirus-related Pol polyprotein from transposon TNT 1-94 [Tanacetum cinerariifolium]